MNNGYNVSGQQQDCYHLDIRNYELPEKVIKKNQENESEGYRITFMIRKKTFRI